jgi:hypothetical protein
MKVKVRWKYCYFQEDTFEEIVEIPDDVDPEDAAAFAWEAAQAAPNGDLTVRETDYPGDPVDELLNATIVEPDAPAKIRWVENDDPELL